MWVKQKRGIVMIYVMSDIHGNRKKFDMLLEQIDLKSDDELYILGDIVGWSRRLRRGLRHVLA